MNSIHRAHSILACLSTLLALSGCNQEPAPQPQPPVKPAAPTVQTAALAATAAAPELHGNGEAKKIFKTRCVVCHGESGHGDGIGAAALKVKPRNYTDGNWQKAVTDRDIETIIVKGGGAVGKDPGMPANPDLKDKPAVVEGLRMIVRSFAPKEEAGGADAASPANATGADKSRKTIGTAASRASERTANAH